MAITPFDFNPSDGWKNTTSFETKPANEGRTRILLQTLPDQIKTWINATLLNGNGTIKADDVITGSALDKRIAAITAAPTWNNAELVSPWVNVDSNYPARFCTTGNLATRAFQNLISPGYLAVSKQTPIDKEVNRLYQATGTTSVLPGTLTSNSYVKTSSGNLYMTPEEKSEFQQTYGRVAAQGIKDLISDSSYTSADDTDPSTLTSYQKGKNPDKKTMVEKVYDAAKNQATAQFLHSRYNKLLSSNKDKFYNSLTAAQKTLFDNYQGG